MDYDLGFGYCKHSWMRCKGHIEGTESLESFLNVLMFVSHAESHSDTDHLLRPWQVPQHSSANLSCPKSLEFSLFSSFRSSLLLESTVSAALKRGSLVANIGGSGVSRLGLYTYGSKEQ